MNGPVPIPITSSQFASFNYSAAQIAEYQKSFKALGSGTTWVRFNDVGVEQLLSISQIYNGWPQTDAALEAANVEALAANIASYNFTGVDKYLIPALEAGRHIDWRIGETAPSLCALTSPDPCLDQR